MKMSYSARNIIYDGINSPQCEERRKHIKSTLFVKFNWANMGSLNPMWLTVREAVEDQLQEKG